MAFSYDDLETTIVNWLQTNISDKAQIAPYPENEGDWLEVKDKPVVYVAYTESDFDPNTATDIVKQKEKPVVVCNVRAKKRRGDGGANSIIVLLYKWLQGLKISGLERLQLEATKLVERDEEKRTWSYNVSFSTAKNQHQLIEDVDLPLTSALLQEVIFNDQVQLP